MAAEIVSAPLFTVAEIQARSDEMRRYQAAAKVGKDALKGRIPRQRVEQGLELLEEQDSDLSWQDEALCAQTDPEEFFPEKGGSTRQAKQICARCDVRAECLETALATDEHYGIWGGLSERERRRLKRSTL